jgi:hypothetical protein
MVKTPDSYPSLFEEPAQELAGTAETIDIDQRAAEIGALPTHRLPSDDRLSAVEAETKGIQTDWENALSRGPRSTGNRGLEASARRHPAAGKKPEPISDSHAHHEAPSEDWRMTGKQKQAGLAARAAIKNITGI